MLTNFLLQPLVAAVKVYVYTLRARESMYGTHDVLPRLRTWYLVPYAAPVPSGLALIHQRS